MNRKIANWNGQRIWIVGASSGIGAATATLLLGLGAKVMLSARNHGALATLAMGHANALAMPADVTDRASLDAAFAQMLTRWHGVDLVLVVAGAYEPMDADNFNLPQATQMLDINLRGALNCLDTVLPQLLQQQRGAIGLVASVAGYSGLPKALVYGATKAALINLAESLYLDLQPRGIGVHLINPGFVATPLTAGNDFSMPALLSPATAAAALVRGLQRGEFHIHFPRRFTNWLRLARLLPYWLYFPLILKLTR